jgi:hypothetical protein
METNKWEECSIDDATHVEINGEVHEIKTGGNQIKTGGKVIKSGKLSIDGKYLCISILFGWYDWMQIPQEAFPLLGIKCLRKVKPTPIEFEATFVSYDGNWRPLYSLDDGIAYHFFKKKKFKCIEILEDEE